MTKKIYFMVIAVLVFIEQLIKMAIYKLIPEGGNIPFVGNIVNLTYVRNTGAAYSLRRK